jgi:hypothetical protein
MYAHVTFTGILHMDPALRPTPVLAITIDHSVSVRPVDGNPKNVNVARSFELVSPLFVNGLRVRCSEDSERSEWLDMIQLVIESESTVASSHGGHGGANNNKGVVAAGAGDVLIKYDTLISEKNAEIERLQRQLEQIRSIGVSGARSVSGRSVAAPSVSGRSQASNMSAREAARVKSTKRKLKRTNSGVSFASAASAALSLRRRSTSRNTRRHSKERHNNNFGAGSTRGSVLVEGLSEDENDEGEEMAWVTEPTTRDHRQQQQQQQQQYTKPKKPQPKQRLFAA